MGRKISYYLDGQYEKAAREIADALGCELITNRDPHWTNQEMLSYRFRLDDYQSKLLGELLKYLDAPWGKETLLEKMFRSHFDGHFELMEVLHAFRDHGDTPCPELIKKCFPDPELVGWDGPFATQLKHDRDSRRERDLEYQKYREEQDRKEYRRLKIKYEGVDPEADEE